MWKVSAWILSEQAKSQVLRAIVWSGSRWSISARIHFYVSGVNAYSMAPCETEASAVYDVETMSTRPKFSVRMNWARYKVNVIISCYKIHINLLKLNVKNSYVINSEWSWTLYYNKIRDELCRIISWL